MKLGDLVLLRMEFHQTAGGKVRPAVVLLDAGDDDLVAAPITSRQRLSEYDLAIQDWKAAERSFLYPCSQTNCAAEERNCKAPGHSGHNRSRRTHSDSGASLPGLILDDAGPQNA